MSDLESNKLQPAEPSSANRRAPSIVDDQIASEFADEHAFDETAQRKPLPPWLLSATFHLLLFIVLGLILRPVTKGVSGEEARGAGIVMVNSASSNSQYLDEAEFAEQSSSSSADSATEDSASPFPNSIESPLDTQGIFPTLDGNIGPAGSQSAQMPDAGQLIQGLGNGGQLGDQASTQVFGAMGTGSKFVYVFDRSSSMEGYGGRPMAAAQRELAASLQAIGEHHQFQIIFYNESPSIFNSNPARPPSLLFGSEENQESAQRFILSMRGSGGTRHLEALLLALKLSPDVIFFLTDAQEPRLSKSELEMIMRRNRSAASINTIEFGAGPQQNKNNFLAQLARQNQGQHVYVDVTKLPSTK